MYNVIIDVMDLYLYTIIALYIVVAVSGYILDLLNLRHIRENASVIPQEFQGHIDEGVLKKTLQYNIEHIKFDLLSSILNNILYLIFILYLLDIYNTWIMSLGYPFIISGLIFFLLLTYAETAVSIPFNLYSQFRIENKYGFNTMTFKLWVSDTIKSLLITTILLSILITVGLYIIQKSPDWWWLWVWGFFFVFSIFIMYISPYVIEPLFHRFSPIEDQALEEKIRLLMQKTGIRVSRIFRVDASRRTRHTNAYFTGIGQIKRIVLYDTLLESMSTEEILAVLAHEAGHWKKRHLLKYIILTETLALLILFVSSHLLKTSILTDIFNISRDSLFARILILGFIGSIVSFPLSPLFNAISRRHEIDADRFACNITGDKASLKSALIKLSKDNLSNLHPHPLYALFHYSHPPVVERIREINSISSILNHY